MWNDTAPPPNLHPALRLTDRVLSELRQLNATAGAHLRHLEIMVDALWSRGVSWATIAQPLGVSRQTAHERFGRGREQIDHRSVAGQGRLILHHAHSVIDCAGQGEQGCSFL